MNIRTRTLAALVAAAMAGTGTSGCSDSGAALQSGDADARIRAIHELAAQGTDAAARQLGAAARHEDARTAGEALAALGRVPGAEAGRVLAEAAAKDPRPALRQAAVMALTQRGGAEARPALRQAVRADPAPEVRGEAAAGQARVGTLEDVDLLVEAATADGNSPAVGREIAAIEQLLGVRFRYDPVASPEERQEALRRVRACAPDLAKKRQAWWDYSKKEPRP